MGAGFFLARPRRKAGFSMGDGNDGTAAQAQVAGEPQAQGDQAAQAAVTAGLQGAGATGNGGGAVERAQKDYEAALKERDESRIAFSMAALLSISSRRICFFSSSVKLSGEISTSSAMKWAWSSASSSACQSVAIRVSFSLLKPSLRGLGRYEFRYE